MIGTIKEVLANSIGFNGTVLAHVMPWFGDTHYHPMTAYRSDDPLIIGKKLDVMQAFGVDGMIVTWQGTSNTLAQNATVEMCQQCAERGMKFVLLADPWLMNNQPNGDALVEAQCTSAAALAMFNSPAYVPEKYFLNFTNNLFNSANVQTYMRAHGVPNFTVLDRHTGYSWPEIVNTMSVLATDNANPGMKIPGLFYKFFDGGWNTPPMDYNTQSWGPPTTSRMIEDQAGNTFFDCLARTPATSKYLALVTWDDYNERTAWEPFASIMCGKRIQ